MPLLPVAAPAMLLLCCSVAEDPIASDDDEPDDEDADDEKEFECCPDAPDVAVIRIIAFEIMRS